MDAAVMGEVCAVPFTLVLYAFAVVKSAWSGLDMTHDCIPVVTQPRSEVCPEVTVFGLATRIMDGWLIFTEHCAPAVRPRLLHVSPYVAVFAPAGGVAIVAVAEPEVLLAVKPLPVAVPDEHEYEMAMLMPMSAVCGWHERLAVGVPPEPDEPHCHPTRHEPL